jgi:Arf-GAP/coiled-coil/ANK repeat/PH domain-containing protein
MAKYIKKDFIATGDDKKEFLKRSVHEAFWDAMDVSDFCEALRYLALGANVDHRNDDHGSMTSLHRAIIRRDDVAVEFLFQWFCDINAVDREGWGALHHAVANDNAKSLAHLIKKHAKFDIRNRDDQVCFYMPCLLLLIGFISTVQGCLINNDILQILNIFRPRWILQSLWKRVRH